MSKTSPYLTALYREAALGHSHHDLTSLIVNLGNTYGVLGEAQKKKELLERALAIQQAHFGAEHIEVGCRQLDIACLISIPRSRFPGCGCHCELG